MSVDERFVFDQALRLRACKFYSMENEKEYLAEAVNALKRCDNDVMVMGVVNEWLSEHDERPTPRELGGLVRAHLSEGKGETYYEAKFEAPSPLTAEEIEENRRFNEKTMARIREISGSKSLPKMQERVEVRRSQIATDTSVQGAD